MELIRIIDKYNPNKVWVIKRYKCGHFSWNQEISGYMKNSKFLRVTKHWIQEVLGNVQF